MIQLSPSEKKLVDYSKKAVTKYNKIRHRKGNVDTLYAFLLADSGKIYDGACFEAWPYNTPMRREPFPLSSAKKRFARVRWWLLALGAVPLLGTALLAARLIWEQTVWT